MKVFFIALLFSLFLCPQQNYGQGTSDIITSAEVTFRFVSKNVNGTINGFRSSSTIDMHNLSNSIFKGSVAVSTLKTRNFLLNWHLKGRKYFNKDHFPLISFESTEIQQQGNQLSVTGKLTIKDTVKPITFLFVMDGNQFIGTATLYSSDFGINIKKKREENQVTIKMVLNL